MTSTPSVEWGPCCFCAQDIQPTATDPCTIQVTTADEKWQVWWCHGECFKARLTNPPEAPDFFDPAHF